VTAPSLDSAAALVSTYGAAPLITTPPPATATTAPPAAAAAAAPPASFTAQPAGVFTGLFSGLQEGVMGFVLKSVFVVTGLGLAALGFWRISEPARAKATAAASSVPIPV
jgi:hypothetical protein